MLARRLGLEGHGSGVAAQRFGEFVVGGCEAEEHLIGLQVVSEVRGVVRLQEVDVEVPWRLCRRALVRGAHEQVATAGRVLGSPVELVGPDAVPGDVGVVALFEHRLEGTEVGLVQPVVIEGGRTLFDALVVVDVLADVEVRLSVVVVSGDELPRDGADDVIDNRLDRRPQEERVEFRNACGQQSQVVSQFGAGRTDRRVDVAGG